MNKPKMTPAALSAFLQNGNLNGTIASSPDGIEQQEKDCQKSLVESQCLPIKGEWEILSRWGIKKGEPVDSLFVSAKLPVGWRVEKTEDTIWSNLIDDRGLIRASIFYKAAFYDQDAFVNPKNRFQVSKNYKRKDGFQFECVDSGLDRVIQRFTHGTYGVLKSDPSVVGFIFDGGFYSETQGEPWDAEFCEAPINGELAMPISNDEFYKQFHPVSERHDLIKASEKKARAGADEWMRRLPTDGTEWSAEFDFPEYTETPQ
jgi:hypothetical protein